MDLTASMFGDRYALAPDLLLTPAGVETDRVLVVEGSRISAVADRAASHPKLPVIPLPGKAIIPGFIDAHTHLGQTFGKAAIAGEPSQIWKRIWLPLEDNLDGESAYVAAAWMLLEAMRGGFTTLVNFTRNSPPLNDAVHKAAADTGMRIVSGCAASTDSPSLRSMTEALEQHVAQCGAHDNIHPSVCFGFFADSMKGFRADDLAGLGAFCRERGILFQMHSNEHFPDVHDCIVNFAKRPIELWHELGILGPSTLLHHATLVSDREIDLLTETDTAISYNPIASEWKGNAVAPALVYASRGIRMGLGTDATRMDAFRNLDAAETCQRIAYGMPKLDFSCGAGWTWVDAGTKGSAAAAGLGGVSGQLVPGLAADFLILDMNRPEMLPSWDFEWELVRYYNRDQIDTVVVAGQPVMLNGYATGFDVDAFVKQYAKLARDTVERAGIIRVHGPSAAYRKPSSP
jgi:cytosine/adenosine deaminase-related metal-dependent hydrolase